MCILSLIQVYTLNSASFDTQQDNIAKKNIVDPYIVHNPAKHE
jgi:hypothetical protein